MKIKHLSILTTLLAGALVMTTASACPMANFINKIFHIDPAKHACHSDTVPIVDNESMQQAVTPKYHKRVSA